MNAESTAEKTIPADPDLLALGHWLTLMASLSVDAEYVQLKTGVFAQKALEIVKLFVELQDFRRRPAVKPQGVLDDSIFETIAGRMYCETGQCGSDPKCFSGADDDVREKWIDAAKVAFNVPRTELTKLADEPPDVLAAKDWLIVLGVLHECQIRLQEGGVRHTWIDGAIGICEYRSKDAVAMPVAEPNAMQFDIGVHFKQLLQTGKRKQLCRDALLENCEDMECMICATAICPHGEPLHFHHDGCPACSTSTKG